MTGTAVAAVSDQKDIAPAAGIRFTVASRPQRRFSNQQISSNLVSGSFSPIQLPATGYVRKIALYFSAAFTSASAAAVVAGDAPWNLVQGVTLTDATGQPIFQPITGYNLYLINKYIPSGMENSNLPRAWGNPHLGPEYAYGVAGGTTGTATFRLDIDLEQDYNTGYGCIPNLDSNASLQLKIDYAAFGNAFSGTGVSASTLQVRIEQWYWAPVGSSINGAPVSSAPVGLGDYVETRYETQPVSAASENTVNLSNRGGLIKGIILVSRAAGVRTAFAGGSNIGLILDNNPIDEGIPVEAQYDVMRRTQGYVGADIALSYAPLTPGVMPGIDRGVLVQPFYTMSGGRDSWLSTRSGSLLQLRLTPGAGATQLEILTQLAQVRDGASFYAASSLD